MHGLRAPFFAAAAMVSRHAVQSTTSWVDVEVLGLAPDPDLAWVAHFAGSASGAGAFSVLADGRKLAETRTESAGSWSRFAFCAMVPSGSLRVSAAWRATVCDGAPPGTITLGGASLLLFPLSASPTSTPLS